MSKPVFGLKKNPPPKFSSPINLWLKNVKQENKKIFMKKDLLFLNFYYCECIHYEIKHILLWNITTWIYWPEFSPKCVRLQHNLYLIIFLLTLCKFIFSLNWLSIWRILNTEKHKFVFKTVLIFCMLRFLTLKSSGEGGEGGQIDPPVVFQKMYLLKRGWNPDFLWLLILSYNTSFLKISLNFEEILCQY